MSIDIRERERESGAIAIDIVYQQLYSCNRHYYFYYHREFDIPSCDISDKVCRELHIWFYNICTIRITLHKCVSNSAVWSPTAKISMIKHQIAHRLSILRNRWHPILLMYLFHANRKKPNPTYCTHPHFLTKISEII
jgi:hypothetical protein